MVAIVVAGFAGMVPRTYRRALGDGQAQVATNVRVTNGQLGPLRNPVSVASPGIVGLASIFRMEGSGGDAWLGWPRDVDVVREPSAADTTQPICWTGDGEPRMSNYEAATDTAPYPSGFFVLGNFPPQSAPTATPSGGSGTDISSSVVYTFVNAFGRESQPSPVSAGITIKPSGATLSIAGMETAPANAFTPTGATWLAGTATYSGVSSTRGLRVGEEVVVSGFTPAGYNVTAAVTGLTGTTVSVAMAADPGAYSAGGLIARRAPHNYVGGMACKRIYVAVTGASGEAEFHLWADNVAIGATTHSTVFNVADVSKATILPSIEWAMPPATGKGLVVMPNGIGVMFSGKDVYLSEPYRLHAWPTAYRQTVPYDIVGLGWHGTTVVICTTGEPYMISGVEPSTMGGGARGLKVSWPCLSKRGIVSTELGVLYPTREGLAVLGESVNDIFTREFYTVEEWRALNPATFTAAWRDNRYYAAYRNADDEGRIIIIDKAEYASVTMAVSNTSRLWTDPLSGKLYLVASDSIHEWDGANGARALFDWFSKEFVFAPPLCLGAAKVDADFQVSAGDQAAAQAAADAVVASNTASLAAGHLLGAADTTYADRFAMDADVIMAPPAAAFDALTFELWVDEDGNGLQLKYSRQVTNPRAFRLPDGYTADTAAVRLAGNVKVSRVLLGETMADLRNV